MQNRCQDTKHSNYFYFLGSSLITVRTVQHSKYNLSCLQGSRLTEVCREHSAGAKTLSNHQLRAFQKHDEWSGPDPSV